MPPSQMVTDPLVRHKRKQWFVFFALLTAVLLFAMWIVLHLGTWLVVQDELGQAHAIVVLSGRIPDRAMEAARVYEKNVAPQVWVSQGASPAAELAKMSISYVGEDFYNRKILMARGVPADAIRVLDTPTV